MKPLPQDIFLIIGIGVGATVVMDVWLAFLKRIGVKTQSFGLIGRWVGHLFRGRLAHSAIAKTVPIRNELALGWATHYAVGIAFAVLLVGLQGMDWTRNPSLLPAVAIGFCTVVLPLFLLQPAMGLGFAGSKTPAPFQTCLRSMTNHTVFGLGLYLSAIFIAWIAR